jgi:hypothetical protein
MSQLSLSQATRTSSDGITRRLLFEQLFNTIADGLFCCGPAVPSVDCSIRPRQFGLRLLILSECAGDSPLTVGSHSKITAMDNVGPVRPRERRILTNAS